MSVMERVLNAVMAIFNFALWCSSQAGQKAWALLVVATLAFVPGSYTWIVNHGVALTRRGPAATIANTAISQVQEAAMKKSAQDALDRMKTLPTSPVARP